MSGLLKTTLPADRELPAPPAAPAHSSLNGREHPRLFMTPDKLAELRLLLDQPGHHFEAFAQLKRRVARGIAAYSGDVDGYRYSWLAREAALAYLLTGERHYARSSFEALMASRRTDRFPEAGYGLSRAMMCVGFALAYDWAFHGWTQEERDAVLRIMKAAADAWPGFEHPNVSAPHKGSNWVGVARGGELIQHLAARGDGDYGERTDRIALCVADLATHMSTAYGASGWTQEGLGYLEYTFGFLAPAVYAAREAGFTELYEHFAAIPWYRLAMHAQSFRIRRNALQSGVGSETDYDEGFASLIFPTVPSSQIGYYRFWYDRHMGVLAADPGYDRHRAGTTWALLYYPAAIRPADPNTGFPKGVVDSGKGIFYFRNRFVNQDDILISWASRNDHHGNAWSQSETFQLAMMGYDTTFAKGPGKDRLTTLYSKLVVDGRPDLTVGRAITRHAELDDRGGGYVVVDAHQNLGLKLAEGHLRVAFAEAPMNQAILVSAYRLADHDKRSFTWQLRPAGEVAQSSGESSGTPTFLMCRGDSFLKGWVLQPSPVSISTEGLLQVRTAPSAATNIVVVLMIGRGQPPEGKVHGSNLAVCGGVYGVASLPLWGFGAWDTQGT